MTAHARSITPQQRLRLTVTGQVQGVGFRPFVYRLAHELGLTGFVRNSGKGVEIEAQGERAALDRFFAKLRSDAPPLARIETIETTEAQPKPAAQEPAAFEIRSTDNLAVRTAIAPDTAVCSDCLRELFDPANRRYRYPFINCTHCGPRYTITRSLPYDRPNTSMARFSLCSACNTEYSSPRDRRFHAQPNACAECGPTLAVLDAQGLTTACADPVAEIVSRLQAGQVLAIKGLGGFHLVCDARNGAAVARLRANKQREQKPLAVMACNEISLKQIAEFSASSARLLASAERPITLCSKTAACNALLPGVADDVPCIGVMLPYTPLHYLLFHQAAGQPAGTQWLTQQQSLLLVMTSANPNGEPLVRDNDEALRRLHGMVDGFVVHNRDIVVRCDDSVIRSDGKNATFLRRARGFTPQGIRLDHPGASVLACGAWHKNTICLTRDRQAFLSQHIGDLDNKANCALFSETVAHLMKVLEIEPRVVAHDLHPDFFSTGFATRFAADRGLPLLPVQHHHAHAAAVMAEHGLRDPVFALTLDGVGLGSDGSLWGGELLLVDSRGFERIGHMRQLPLPGGDRAAREPWRMAAAVLHILDRGDEIVERFPQQAGTDVVTEMLRRGFLCPPTSSAGRWFDAAAGILGVSRTSDYEAHSAMKLEKLALDHGPAPAMRDGFRIDRRDGKLILDLLPVFDTLARLRDAALGASLFHSTLIYSLTNLVIEATHRFGPRGVVLAGGCFLNSILTEGVTAALEENGFTVYRADRVPPNDGGTSLGQAWIAMQLHTEP